MLQSTHLQGSTLITSTVYTISYGAVLDRDIISRSSYNPSAWITLFHNPVFSCKKVSLERWLTTQGETAQTWSLQTASKGEAERDRQWAVQPTYRPTTSTETYSRASRMNSYCFWLVFGRCRVEILVGLPKAWRRLFKVFVFPFAQMQELCTKLHYDIPFYIISEWSFAITKTELR